MSTHKSWGTDLTGFRNLSGPLQNVEILLDDGQVTSQFGQEGLGKTTVGAHRADQ